MNLLLDVKLTEIQIDPNQPRKDFDVESLNELSGSIKAVGVMQAITIRKTPESFGGAPYMIIAGERRWRASKIAGMDAIPAILKEVDDADESNIKAQQLTENLFRVDLNPVEKAEFLQGRIDELKNADVAGAANQVALELGVSSSWISKNIAILRVPEDIRSLARIGKIRDYSIVKQVDKLSGTKREEALTQIRNGTFNAKEFFKRRRYDKTVTESVEVADIENTVKKPVRLSFNTKEIILLIDRTEYSKILDAMEPTWRVNEDRLPEYLVGFKNWLNPATSSGANVAEGEGARSHA